MQVILRPSVVLLTAALVMAVPTLDGDRVGVQAGIPAPTLLRYPYVQQVTMTSALVVWTTSEDGTSEVRFGTDSSPGSTVVATSQQFIEPEIPDEVARTYYVHVAELSGLQPGETYGYTVLSGGIDLTSADALSFRTDSGPSNPTLSLLVFGDSGTGAPNQLAIRDAMGDRDFDLAIHTGDVAYPHGTYRQLDDTFFSVYRTLISSVPFFLSLGNHDYDTLEGQPFVDLLYLPDNATPPVAAERYYSFDYGPAHFVALDAEILADFHGPAASTEMLAWLKQDLLASNQAWKFVFLHKTPYGSSDFPSPAIYERMLPAIEEAGVDIVFNGHHHQYAQTLPLKAGIAQLIGDGGIVHVTSGGAGGGTHQCIPRWYTASCMSAHHFLHLNIRDDCRLSYDVVGFNREVLASFELDRCDPDSDGDSYTDAAEAQAGSDPLDPSSAPPTPTPTPLPSLINIGDANCDGTINSIDAAIVLQNTAQLLTFLPCALFADVNRDGRINSVDAALILQFSAGLISSLPP